MVSNEKDLEDFVDRRRWHRGLIPAYILASIEQRTQKPISELFDLIAGTSTGGILALGLTKPDSSGKPEFTAARLCELYQEQIPNIFRNPQSWWGNLLSPKYRSHAFQQILKDSFGDCRLKSALTDVVIPCYDIEHRTPFMFKSRLAKLHSESDFQMRNVALAASASPTLFYPVRIPRPSVENAICLVDGGVFANNPATIALSETMSMAQGADESHFIVSLGTGKFARPLSDELVSLWGYVQWSRPMLELVMESSSESAHDQIRHLLSSADEQRYYRLQVDLPDQVATAMDDASPQNMQVLTEVARDFSLDSGAGQELNKMCDTLVRLSEEKAVTMGR